MRKLLSTLFATALIVPAVIGTAHAAGFPTRGGGGGPAGGPSTGGGVVSRPAGTLVRWPRRRQSPRRQWFRRDPGRRWWFCWTSRWRWRRRGWADFRRQL